MADAQINMHPATTLHTHRHTGTATVAIKITFITETINLFRLVALHVAIFCFPTIVNVAFTPPVALNRSADCYSNRAQQYRGSNQ